MQPKQIHIQPTEGSSCSLRPMSRCCMFTLLVQPHTYFSQQTVQTLDWHIQGYTTHSAFCLTLAPNSSAYHLLTHSPHLGPTHGRPRNYPVRIEAAVDPYDSQCYGLVTLQNRKGINVHCCGYAACKPTTRNQINRTSNGIFRPNRVQETRNGCQQATPDPLLANVCQLDSQPSLTCRLLTLSVATAKQVLSCLAWPSAATQDTLTIARTL